IDGSGFCLDAGSNPASGVGMKIWTCYDNLPAQQWTYTSDNYVRLMGLVHQCLDLTNDDLTNSNQVQTWQCSGGNNNQLWSI
ncbi:ricin B lectin domain-containing protein, partial [Crucibulum laeve]